MTEPSSALRTTRSCDVCGQSDDHPHHVVFSVAAHPVTGRELDFSLSRHLDCCRDNDCHDGSCHVILSHAGDLRGLALADHIQQHGDEIAGLVAQSKGD